MMKIIKTYRTPYMAIDLCRDNEIKMYVVICSKCDGQRDYWYRTWNEAQKQCAQIVWLTNAVEAPRK